MYECILIDEAEEEYKLYIEGHMRQNKVEVKMNDEEIKTFEDYYVYPFGGSTSQHFLVFEPVEFEIKERNWRFKLGFDPYKYWQLHLNDTLVSELPKAPF